MAYDGKLMDLDLIRVTFCIICGPVDLESLCGIGVSGLRSQVGDHSNVIKAPEEL